MGFSPFKNVEESIDQHYIEIILRTVRVNIPKLGEHVVILLRNPESSMASIED